MFAKHRSSVTKLLAFFLALLFFLLNSTIGSSLVSYTATVIMTPLPEGQTLYAHQETYAYFHYFRLYSADASGETHSAQTDLPGRKSMGNFTYELASVTSINASTWTFYYRTQKTHILIRAHCEVDILIRKADGNVRTWIASNVANSGELTMSWSTLSGTFQFPGYTVVNQTDYLEVDYYIDITANRNNKLVSLRIDDNTLALADQTRVASIDLRSP